MNKTLANLLIFSAGLLAGGGGTCYFWKKYYEQRANEEIESVKAVFTFKKSDIPVVDDPNNPKDDKGDNVNPTGNFFVGPNPGEPVDYSTFYESKVVPATETNPLINDKLEAEMAKNESPTEKQKPYFITEDDYTDSEPGYDKLSCTYYVPDRVLVDDLSREVVEVDTVGEENLDFLARSTNEIVYVRNDNISCDFEVMRSIDSIEDSGAQVWYG